MSKIVQVTGRGLPLPGDDIDTDRIIPARYLKCVTFDGLGEVVFIDDRRQDTSHPFDAPQYQGAQVLVVGRNFGCGSSREHAPQAIARWGIKAIVGESFAEIFFGNCVAIGLPCLTATGSDVRTLQEALARDPQAQLRVDLEAMHLQAGDLSVPVQMPSGPRQMFISGTWDATGQLLSGSEAIKATAARLPYLAWSR